MAQDNDGDPANPEPILNPLPAGNEGVNLDALAQATDKIWSDLVELTMVCPRSIADQMASHRGVRVLAMRPASRASDQYRAQEAMLDASYGTVTGRMTPLPPRALTISGWAGSYQDWNATQRQTLQHLANVYLSRVELRLAAQNLANMHQAVAGLQNSSLMTGGLEPRFWVMNDDPVNAAWAQAELNQARIDLANDPVLWPFATGPSPATDTSPDPDVASDPAPQAPPLHLDGLPSGREAEIDGRVYEQIYFANNTCRRCAFNSVTLCPPKPDFEVLCTPDENADGMARQWRLKVQEEIGDD